MLSQYGITVISMENDKFEKSRVETSLMTFYYCRKI